MAHVNMHQAHDSGMMRAAIDALSRRRNVEREIESSKFINAQNIAKDLQINRSRLDQDLEVAKLNLRNQRELAKFKAGIDMQLKQMGIDLDLELQKMRNLNAVEIQQLNAKLATMLEALKDTHKQNEILKTYQTELELAKYNAKVALMNTYVKTMGDIYRTGNPAENAIDALAYTAWAIAFKLAYAKQAIEPEEGMKTGDLRTKVNLDSSEGGITNEEINELIEALRGEKQSKGSEHLAKGSKVTKYAQPGFKTRVQMFYNERKGREKR